MKIRELRAGRKQYEIAEAVGIDVNLMSKVENGKALLPPKKREELCKVLGCKISEIYAFEELIGLAELEDLQITFRRGAVKIRTSRNVRMLNVKLSRKEFSWLKPKVWRACGYLSLSEFIRYSLSKLKERYEALQGDKNVDL